MSYQPHLPWFNPPISISFIQYIRIEQNERMCQPAGSIHCGLQGDDTSGGRGASLVINNIQSVIPKNFCNKNSK